MITFSKCIDNAIAADTVNDMLYQCYQPSQGIHQLIYTVYYCL